MSKNSDRVVKIFFLCADIASQGRYAEAGRLYKRSLEIRERVLGRDHPEVALSLQNKASLLERQVMGPRNILGYIYIVYTLVMLNICSTSSCIRDLSL